MVIVSRSKLLVMPIWVYHRFSMSFRDVEDLLAERGIDVSYETIRRWCEKFGPDYVRKLKRAQGRLGDTWYLDEVFIRINGQQQYLWRAVDQDGDVIDILVQPRRDLRAAERFLRRLVRGKVRPPFRMITDKLKSYGAAKRTIFPGVTHDTGQYANNRTELSPQPTRVREQQMRRFKSSRQGLNDFFLRTASSRICFAWAANMRVRGIIGSCDRDHSRSGGPSPRPKIPNC